METPSLTSVPTERHPRLESPFRIPGFTFLDLRRARELFEGLAKSQMTPEKWTEYTKEYQPFLLPFDAVAAGIREDGDLDRVRRVVRLGGFVQASPGFTDHPKILNGASELMVDVFGPIGRHARFAVGAPSLPLGAAVEIEAMFEIA